MLHSQTVTLTLRYTHTVLTPNYTSKRLHAVSNRQNCVHWLQWFCVIFGVCWAGEFPISRAWSWKAEANHLSTEQSCTHTFGKFWVPNVHVFRSLVLQCPVPLKRQFCNCFLVFNEASDLQPTRITAFSLLSNFRNCLNTFPSPPTVLCMCCWCFQVWTVHHPIFCVCAYINWRNQRTKFTSHWPRQTLSPMWTRKSIEWP